MGTVKVRYFKTRESGYYWVPTPKVRELGFEPEALGKAIGAAVTRATHLNDQVAKAKAGETPSRQVKPGTVSELIYLYRGDDAYLALAARTKRGYEQCLDAIEAWAGDKHVKAISRRAVKIWYRTMRARTPAKAAAIIRVLSVLMAFGMDEGYRRDNPASRMRLYRPGGETEQWPQMIVERYCEMAIAEGRPSMALAVMLAWCLGQRETDILAMTRRQDQGSQIELQQSKTGHKIAVPVLPELRAAIDATPVTSPLFVVSEATGKPYGEHHFRHTFAAIRKKAGIPTKYKFMGLRHSAAQRLGDAGCTEDEIRAITGHKARESVAPYVRPSTTMARAAIAKLDRRRKDKKRGA